MEGVRRRSTRNIKPTTKACENEYVKNLSRSGFIGNISDSSESSSDDENLDEIEELGTPSVLQNDSNVKGDQIFHFQNRKTKKSLLDKVKEVNELSIKKTPSIQRNRLKNEIRKALSENDDSESDYVPSDKSSSENDDSEEEDEPPIDNVNNDKLKIEKTKHRNEKSEYLIKTDDYFTNQGSKKVVTSDHTLDQLETPRLPQDQLLKLIKNMTLTEHHQKCLNNLSQINTKIFTKWLFLLHENFNILLYGLGSKRNIIDEFSNLYLKNSPVIVVNGFFPSLSIKDILDAIIDLLELKKNPSNICECCDLIEQELINYQNLHIYLIIHNIDGEMLRNSKAQNTLTKLVTINNIHLIASIDHINAPLIWDHVKLSKFNYTWWDMTSYLPYIEETSFESSMMIQKNCEFALSSLRNVFLSLTTNSKGIFLNIVKHQLDNTKNQYYQGLAFKDLYSSCRESFLVSSDLALRAQLTEFVDHKMIKLKRSIDGVEYLIIPISNVLLQKFLDEQN